MAIREKFGRLILLEHGEPGPLGLECRAARLGPAGLERLVTVTRFSPAVSSSAEATKRLVEQARLAARIQSPGLVRVLGIGRVEQSFYVSTELVEGRSVAAILERCRTEGFPFAADHALMIASRAAAALEPLHAKKDDAGEPLAHGLVAPSRLLVTYDGEVKVRGLGLWPGLRGTGLLPPEECRYLAPEQAAGEPGGPRSDVYALGQVLLEALTGLSPGGTDPASRLAGAQLTSAAGEPGPLPPPLADLLRRALESDPAARFGGAAALRKAIDALVFSGDFAPTTFDLAFFMHTLFREEIEREAKALEEARSASYAEFLVEQKPAPAPPATEPDSPPAPPLPVPPPAAPILTDVQPPTAPEATRRAAPERPAATPGPDASESRGASRAAREAAAREAAARMTLGATAPADRRGLWLLLGLLGAVIAAGGAGFMYFVKLRGPAPATPATLAASAAAAQERVRELEARIAQLEREKGEAEARAAEEARQTVEARAAAGGGPADPVAVAQAQEEARRRARAEQETKQQEELRRLADEKKAEERRVAEATPSPTPAPTLTPEPLPEAIPAPTPTPEPVPLPPPVPSTRPGSLVEYTDPGLTRPVVVADSKPRYPPLAEERRLDGTVELVVLVDETGAVAEVKVVTASPRGIGFEAEATRYAKSCRYRPGTKDGVPVRVRVPIVVKFPKPRG
jgi:serine/threonine-protein kinase